MSKQISTILSVRNITHLKHILKTKKELIPLSQYPSNYFNVKKQNSCFVSLDKIKEFSSVVTTRFSLIVGLNTNIQKIIDIHKHYPLPQIIIDIIEYTIPNTSFQSVRLLDIISNNPQYILIRLVFSMLKTKILTIKYDRHYWMSFDEYIENEMYSFKSVPLSLQFNLDIQINHVITCRNTQNFMYPSFTVIGLVQLNTRRNKLTNIHVYVYKNKKHYVISQPLIQFKQYPYPLDLTELLNSPIKQKLSISFLSKIEQSYFLENVITLLHPNIV